MKNTLAIIALLCCSIFALGQSDVPVPSRANYFDVGRGLNWAGSGVGNLNNNFILTLAQPSNLLCVYVTNNDVSAHTFTLTAWTTADPTLTSFTGVTPGKWYGTFPFIPQGINYGASGLSSGSTMVLSVNTPGAARVTIQLTNGSGAGTADIYAVQATTGCMGVNTAFYQGTNGAYPPTQCDTPIIPVTVVPGATVPLMTGAQGRGIAICWLVIANTNTVTTLGSQALQASTALASCTGLTNLYLFWVNGTAAGASTPFLGSNTGFLARSQVSQSWCLTNNNVTAGTVQVTGAYAYF